MSIIGKMMAFVKNIFHKKVKVLEAPKEVEGEESRTRFAESLKVVIAEKRKKKKIETLVCEGDGLGIQGKISY